MREEVTGKKKMIKIHNFLQIYCLGQNGEILAKTSKKNWKVPWEKQLEKLQKAWPYFSWKKGKKRERIFLALAFLSSSSFSLGTTWVLAVKKW